MTAAILEQLRATLTELADSSHSVRLQIQALRLLSKLPDELLRKVVALIEPKVRFEHADPLMQLIMTTHSTGSGMVTADVLSSRQRFHDKITALQGLKPPVHASQDLSFVNRSGQTIKLRHYIAETDINKTDITNSTTTKPTNAPSPADAPSTANTARQMPSTSPLIVFFHGGGFALGDLDTHDEFCHYLCHYSGFNVLSVDYRLAPEHPAPSAVYDAIDAVLWAGQQHETLGFKAGHIIVCGDSAGGNLAAVVSQQLNDNAEYHTYCPIMQWLIYPVTDNKSGADPNDPTDTYPSYQKYGTGTLLSLHDKALFTKFYLAGCTLAKRDPLVSPIYGKVSELPPALIISAEMDILADEAQAYAGKLEEDVNNVVHFETASGMPHGFVNLINIHDGARQRTVDMIRQMRQFYFQHTSPH